MARTNFSPGRDSRTGKGVTSSRQGPSRISLGFDYKLRFKYKLPKGLTGGAIFTVEEVRRKLEETP